MNRQNKPLTDPDLIGVGAALVRAGNRAREVARRTGTKLVYLVDGKIIEVGPDEPVPAPTAKPRTDATAP